MEERNFNLEGLVIRARDYGDNDKIITFLSIEKGKICGIAKGVRKQQSSLKGPALPFVHSKLAFAAGRGSLYTITQGEVIEPYFTLRTDLTKIAYASYLSELTDSAIGEHRAVADVYGLLLACFTMLENDVDARMVARLFELRFLKLFGVAPKLDRCVLCGKPAAYNRFFLSNLRGGLICETCAGKYEGSISSGTAQIMKRLSESDLDKLLRLKISDDVYTEIYNAVIPYLDYHLDYSSRARRFLQSFTGD